MEKAEENRRRKADEFRDSGNAPAWCTLYSFDLRKSVQKFCFLRASVSPW